MWGPGNFHGRTGDTEAEKEYFNECALQSGKPSTFVMVVSDDSGWHTLTWNNGDTPHRTPLQTFPREILMAADLRANGEGVLQGFLRNHFGEQAVWSDTQFRTAFPERGAQTTFSFRNDARHLQLPLPVITEPLPPRFGQTPTCNNPSPHSGDLNGSSRALAHSFAVSAAGITADPETANDEGDEGDEGDEAGDEATTIPCLFMTVLSQKPPSGNGFYDSGLMALHLTPTATGSFEIEILGVRTWTACGYTVPPLNSNANAYAWFNTAYTGSLDTYGVGAGVLRGRDNTLCVLPFSNTSERVGMGHTMWYAGLFTKKGLLIPADLEDPHASPNEIRFDGVSPNASSQRELLRSVTGANVTDTQQRWGNGFTPSTQIVAQHIEKIQAMGFTISPVVLPQAEPPAEPTTEPVSNEDATVVVPPACPKWLLAILADTPMENPIVEDMWTQALQQVQTMQGTPPNDVTAATTTKMCRELLPTLLSSSAPAALLQLQNEHQRMERRRNIVVVGEDACSAAAIFGLNEEANFVHQGPVSFISSNPTTPFSQESAGNQMEPLAYAMAMLVATEGPRLTFQHTSSTPPKVAVDNVHRPRPQRADATPIVVLDRQFNSVARSVAQLQTNDVTTPQDERTPVLVQRGYVLHVTRVSTLSNRATKAIRDWNGNGVLSSVALAELPMHGCAIAGAGVVLVTVLLFDRNEIQCVFTGGTYPTIDDDLGRNAQMCMDVLFSDDPSEALAKCGGAASHAPCGPTAHRTGYVDPVTDEIRTLDHGRREVLEMITEGVLKDDMPKDMRQIVFRNMRPYLEAVSMSGDSVALSKELIAVGIATAAASTTTTTTTTATTTATATPMQLQARLDALREVVRTNMAITPAQIDEWKALRAQLRRGAKKPSKAQQDNKRPRGIDILNKLTSLLYNGRDNGSRVTSGQMSVGGAAREAGMADMNTNARTLSKKPDDLFDYCQQHPNLTPNFLVLEIQNMHMLEEMTKHVANGTIPPQLNGSTSAVTSAVTAPLRLNSRCSFVDEYTHDALAQGRHGEHPMLVEDRIVPFIGGNMSQPMVLWPLPNLDEQLNNACPANVAVDYAPFGALLGVMKLTLFGTTSALCRNYSIGDIDDPRTDQCMLYLILLIGRMMLQAYPSGGGHEGHTQTQINPRDVLPACFRSLVQMALVVSGRGGVTPINRVIAGLFHGRPMDSNPGAFDVAACQLLGEMAMRGGVNARLTIQRLLYTLCVRPLNTKLIQSAVTAQTQTNEQHKKQRQNEDKANTQRLNSRPHLTHVFDAMVAIKAGASLDRRAQEELYNHISSHHEGGHRNPNAHGGRRLLSALLQQKPVAQLHRMCGANKKLDATTPLVHGVGMRIHHTSRDDYYDEAMLRFFEHGVKQVFNMIRRDERERFLSVVGGATAENPDSPLVHLCMIMGTGFVSEHKSLNSMTPYVEAETKRRMTTTDDVNPAAHVLYARISAFRDEEKTRVLCNLFESHAFKAETSSMQPMVDAHAQCWFVPYKISDRLASGSSSPRDDDDESPRQETEPTTTPTTTPKSEAVVVHAQTPLERLEAALAALEVPAPTEVVALTKLLSSSEGADHGHITFRHLCKCAPDAFQRIPFAFLLGVSPPGDADAVRRVLDAVFAATAVAMERPGVTLHDRPIAEATMLEAFGYPLAAGDARAFEFSGDGGAAIEGAPTLLEEGSGDGDCDGGEDAVAGGTTS